MKIAELFVKKQLVSDVDTGIKTILKSLNVKDGVEDKDFTIDYALF